MNRYRSFFLAVLAGTFLIGPAVIFMSFSVRFAFGLTSSAAFTSYAAVLLQRGMIMGLISGFACSATRLRPWASAWLAGAVVLAWKGHQIVPLVMQGLPSRTLHVLPVLLVMDVLVPAVTAYLTAILVLAWERGQQHHPTPQPTSQTNPRTESFRYHI
jgi:hypothetical protein